MSTIFKTLESTESGELRTREVNLESLPEFADISSRFESEFPKFVRETKIRAVINALEEELGAGITLKMPRLVSDTMANLSDEDFVEKPYVFISLNPKVMI